MAVRPITESDLSKTSSGRVRKLGEEEVTPDLLHQAANIANDINWGITSAIPGLNYFTAKYLGIGGDTPRGEDGEVTAMQGGARMVGLATTYSVAALWGGLRQLASTAASVAPDMSLGQVVNGFLKRTAQAAVDAPKTALAAETSSAFVSGASGQAVYNQTNDPTLKAITEIATGAVTAFGAPIISKAADYSVVGALARRSISAMIRPQVAVTVKSGQMGADRAAKRIRQAIPDPEGFVLKSKSGADVLDNAPLTAGEKYEIPELLSLEKAIINSSEDLTFQNQSRFDTINKVVRSEMEDIIPDREIRPEEATAYLDNLLDERIRIAGVKADEALSSVSTTRGRGDANLAARDALEGAYADALKQEKVFWSQVPDTAPVTPDNAITVLKDRLTGVLDNRVAKALQDVPQVVKTFLGRVNKKGEFIGGKLAKGGTLKELQSLRSEMLREIRAERAKDAPDRSKISLLNDIQESLLSDMDIPGGDSIKLALDFSKSVNTKFRQGDVGAILGYQRTGEGSVPPLLTLEKTLGKSAGAGSSAKQAVSELMSATNNSTEMRSAMTDFLIDEFRLNASRSGTFDPNAARRYMSSRKEVLEQFPDLRSRMDAAVKTGQDFTLAQKLKNPSQSPAAIILGKQPKKAVGDIMNSGSPGASMKSVIAELSTDKTGKALPAFRRAALDWLMDAAQSKTALDSNEAPVIMGSKLLAALDDRLTNEALSALFPPEQMKRLRTIQNTAMRRELSEKAGPAKEGVLNDVEGMFSEAARRILSAGLGRNIARKAGMGGTVQIPGMFVGLSNRLRDAGIDPGRKLVIDAVMSEDDQLLKSLLFLPQGQASIKAAQKRINSWAAATAREYGLSYQQIEKEAAEQNGPDQ